MLINCPKCGFSQPKDRFCANCGVDIDAFRPAALPLWKRLLENPLFHLTVILALTLVFVYFIRYQRNQGNLFQQASPQAGPLIVERREPPPSGYPGEPQDENELPPTTLPAATNTTTTRPSEAPADPARQQKITAKIIYAEVDRAVMDNLRQESAGTGQYTELGDFRAGALPEIGKKIAGERGIVVLQRVEKYFDNNTLHQQWFVGSKFDDDSEIGLSSVLGFRANNDRTYHGELEVIRSLRETRDGPPVQRAYPINTFDISPGMGWMMNINLPRQIEQLDSNEAAAEGFMRLFRSARFKAGQSEFTLFIEFDTPSGAK